MPAIVRMAEVVPTAIQYSALYIGYNSSMVLLGGTTLLMATALIAATGNRLAPSLPLMVAAFVTLVTVLTTHDRYREPLT